MKVWEIRTFVVFDLVFSSNTLLQCFFFVFLIIELCVLIPRVIAKSFNATAELPIPTRIADKEAKSEKKAQHVEAKIPI